MIIHPADDKNPVATSYFELDETKLKEDGHFFHYASGENKTYISDYQKNPDSGFSIQIEIPEEDSNFGQYQGMTLTRTGVVLFPVSVEKSNPDYMIPGSNYELPNVLLPGETPSFHDENVKYPLIIYSHGYSGSPVDQLDIMKKLAANGYVVVGIFHGDLGVQGIDRDEQRRNQLSLRIQSIIASIEKLKNDENYNSHIDFEKIGLAGLSFGGATMMTILGAKITTKDGMTALADYNEIKAAAGFIPYLGSSEDRCFNTQSGIENIDVPILLISGEKDESAPADIAEEVIRMKSSLKYMSVIDGIGHTTSKSIMAIMSTLSLLLFDGYLKNDQESILILENIKEIERVQKFKFIDFTE